MAFAMFNRVRETTLTTWSGTGDVALNAAYSDHRRFSDVYSVGDTMFYCINHPGSNAWEVGFGTYSASNTLTRTTVIESTNSNLAVNFSSGTAKEVFVAWPASVAKNTYNNTNMWAAAAGTNTITLTFTPALTAYFDGLMVYFRQQTTNTGAVTININSLGARSITKSGGTALAASDLLTNGEYAIRYNLANTRFEIVGAALP